MEGIVYATPLPIDEKTVIRCITRDGKSIDIMKSAAMKMCGTLANILGDLTNVDEIPTPEVSHDIMVLVKEFIEFKTLEEAAKAANPAPVEEKPLTFGKKNEKSVDPSEIKNPWDKQFIARFERNELFGITMAASYLDCTQLFDLACMYIAGNIKPMTVEGMCKKMAVALQFFFF